MPPLRQREKYPARPGGFYPIGLIEPKATHWPPVNPFQLILGGIEHRRVGVAGVGFCGGRCGAGGRGRAWRPRCCRCRHCSRVRRCSPTSYRRSFARQRDFVIGTATSCEPMPGPPTLEYGRPDIAALVHQELVDRAELLVAAVREIKAGELPYRRPSQVDPAHLLAQRVHRR